MAKLQCLNSYDMIKDFSTVAAVIVSVFALALFLVALLIAYYIKSDTALTLLFGAASANCTAVVSYWVGSSASSRKKDDTIANITSATVPGFRTRGQMAPGAENGLCECCGNKLPPALPSLPNV